MAVQGNAPAEYTDPSVSDLKLKRSGETYEALALPMLTQPAPGLLHARPIECKRSDIYRWIDEAARD